MNTTDLQKLLDEVTPGQWASETLLHSDPNGGDYPCDVEVSNEAGRYIHGHDLGYDDKVDDEIQANARLIALAPEIARRVIAAEKLAEALKHMVAQFQHPDQMADEALAAWEAAQ